MQVILQKIQSARIVGASSATADGISTGPGYILFCTFTEADSSASLQKAAASVPRLRLWSADGLSAGAKRWESGLSKEHSIVLVNQSDDTNRQHLMDEFLQALTHLHGAGVFLAAGHSRLSFVNDGPFTIRLEF